MRHLAPADYVVMPWKNGGGTTTELYKEVDANGVVRWRVSIATVSADGPFSLFAGYDRHIMAIEGHGMVLEGGPHGPIEVALKFSPKSFSGDWPIFSRLIAGPVRDFNLIARRDLVTTSLACAELTGPLLLGGEASTMVFAHVLESGIMINGADLLAGQSVVIEPGEPTIFSRRQSAAGLPLIVCRIVAQ